LLSSAKDRQAKMQTAVTIFKQPIPMLFPLLWKKNSITTKLNFPELNV
jgi:hypothetical protein